MTYTTMIATEMWKHDGEPDGRAETEVDRAWYVDRVCEVLESLERLGLKVVRRGQG